MFKLPKVLPVIALTVISVLGFSSAASAVPTLQITNGATTVTSIAAGDVFDAATSADIPGVGVSSHTVALDWSSQSLQLNSTSSIVHPEGWSLEYSTDGSTWSNTAPGNLSTIVSVRSVGDINATGTNAFQTGATTSLMASQTNFQGSSGGDGYDLTFAGDKVFNVFHHNASQIQLDCHIKSTGASCYSPSVTNFPGYATSNTSSAYYDAASFNLFVMSKKISTNEPGLACINVTGATPVPCSTPFYALDVSLPAPATVEALRAGARSGDLVYLINSSNNNLLCFNVATATACSDYPKTLPGTITATSIVSRISALGTKIWYNTTTAFGCWDTVTSANCGGVAPQTIAAADQYPPFPARAADGTLLGFCTYLNRICVDSSNAVFAMPSGLLSFVSGTTLPLWNYYGAGQWAEAGNKLYLNKGPFETASNNVYCHDFATDAACAGFSGMNLGTRIYSILADPSNSNCIWTNGDAGNITTFNATTGLAGCASSIPVVEIPYSVIIPRMSCEEAGRVTAWKNIAFNTPVGISSSDLRVTIYDSAGSPISGWVDQTPTSAGVLDLTGLTTAQTGTRPTIRISAGSVLPTLLDDITSVAQFEAAPPELCIELKAVANCPDFIPANGDTSVPNGLLRSVSITTPTSGSVVSSHTQTTLTGTNTGTVCLPTIALLITPTVGNSLTSTSLANTGAKVVPQSLLAAFAILAGLSLVGFSILRRNRVLG